MSRTLSLALLTSVFVAISPVSSNAAAPVGNQNMLAASFGTASSSLFMATQNSGTAVVASATTVASTGHDARSKGLVLSSSGSTTSTAQTATLALSGVLSLYHRISTTVAIQVSGGTLSSPIVGGNAGDLNSGTTVALFTRGTVATGGTTATGMAVLYTAPSTAGTYTISLYADTTTTGVALTNPTAGTSALSTITVTVGGTHPAVSGTNSPDTLGAINGSMFTAVADNNGLSGVIHPAATLGVGETTALSKGLLYKDSSFTTAQKATVLTGGVLSLYANVSTTSAFTASGGSFASTSGSATYSDSVRTTLVTRANTTTVPIATLWTAPSTAGTYTVSLYVHDATTAPTESAPAVSLAAAITVTVVAASGGSVYSAGDSTCTVATVSIEAAALDNTSSTVTNGSWYINYDLQDAYGVDLPLGSIIATATTGGLVSLGAATATPSAGTDATQVALDTGGSNTVRVTQAVAGAPTTTTVNITYNGTTVCTKTVTIRGSVNKLDVTVWGTQDLGGSDYPAATYNHDGSNLDGGLFTVTAKDSAGNIVTPTLSGFSEVASTMGATIQALGFVSVATSTSSTSVHSYTRGNATCGSAAGSASVQVKYTDPASGVITTSAPFTLRCADEAYTYTASWDKASYVQGEIATLTVKFLDSKGNASNRKLVTAALASTDTHVTVPMMNAVTAVTGTTVRPDAAGVKTYTFTVGTSSGITAGSYNAIVDYYALTAVAATKQTPGYKVTAGSTDVTFTEVLKSVVALIASINKQIQALQKLILNKR